MNRTCSLMIALLTLMAASSPHAEPGRITVQVDHATHKISPTFYGLMTEEINHSYDGGLYAELLQNRVFKDNPNTPVHWSLVQGTDSTGAIALDATQPLNDALPVSLKLTATSVGKNQRIGVANNGYWGIPVKPETSYQASFYAKAAESFSGPLTVSLESSDGATVHARAEVDSLSTSWRQCHVTLKTGDAPASLSTRFVVSMERPGTIWLNLVSLFPPTFKNRINGNRADLMDKLIGLRPSFLRLPGGNYLEGDTIAARFAWKDTIGDLTHRAGHQGPWGYRSSDGMGLLEFLEWCEDMHAQPVLGVYAGYSLKGEHVVPGPDLAPYVQDALDEIQYIMGDAATKWGARRVADGHPAPFPLTYVEIGNEDGFDRSNSYDGRYARFYDAIKAAYPKLQLIATAQVKSRTPDVVDDHYYRSAADMERDSAHYDDTDRSGPKIFVGEWASTEGSPTPTMQAALGDAAWLTGLERDSDVVVMEAYAPLLVNVNPNASQWGTNLIGYDGLNSFGSPSYYVQSLFAASTGDVELPVTMTDSPGDVPAASQPHGKIGVGTWATQAEFKDIKVTRDTRTLYQSDFTGGSAGWTSASGQWQAADGVLRQTSDDTDCRDFSGSPDWTDYICTLKARKISGAEGFLIAFHARDDQNYLWWNVGGWGNTRTAIQQFSDGNGREISDSTPVTVETDRWYDIRVEVLGRIVKCYLDGKLVSTATDAPPIHSGPIFSAASRDTKTGDVFVKVVNASPNGRTVTIDLQGISHLGTTAESQVISGEPDSINTISAPKAIVPVSENYSVQSPTFMHTFPANSVTVIRFKTHASPSQQRRSARNAAGARTGSRLRIH